MSEYVELMVVDACDGATQPVEAERVGASEYRILSSPDHVAGIAAGDVVRVTDEKLGRFEILSRGGNLAVKLGAPGPIAATVPATTAALEAVGGRLDRATEHLAVWTVPVTAGFERVEAIMTAAVARLPVAGWFYGNVYDDSGRPLGWWAKILRARK